VEKLNERFGTDFTEADQLFFDQIRASAEADEKIVEAARANNLTNFSSYLERILDELFIARMEGNEDIFSRVMTDSEFRSAAREHLAQEIFRRVREEEPAN
jgi:type I restriction enzyme R subunit